MIDDVDEILRQLLIRELPIQNGQVDISFDQPKREWSARIGGRPTLNLFLYDLRENQKLRQTQPAWEIIRNADGSVTQRRRPVRVDLHYMITIWAAEPEDEHRLLTRTLLALFRHPHLPGDLLPASLQDQPAPIGMMVAQIDEYRNPTDIWNVLDNEMRPAIACVITLSLNPYQPITGPLVRVRELRFGPAPRPWLERLVVEPDSMWAIGGTVHSEQPLDRLRVTLVEHDLNVALQPDGRFVIGHLRQGEYTLKVSLEDADTTRATELRQFKIVVPAAAYDLHV